MHGSLTRKSKEYQSTIEEDNKTRSCISSAASKRCRAVPQPLVFQDGDFRKRRSREKRDITLLYTTRSKSPRQSSLETPWKTLLETATTFVVVYSGSKKERRKKVECVSGNCNERSRHSNKTTIRNPKSSSFLSALTIPGLWCVT